MQTVVIQIKAEHSCLFNFSTIVLVHVQLDENRVHVPIVMDLDV